MTGLLITLSLVLLVVVVVQIAKMSELSDELRGGGEDIQESKNRRIGSQFLIFGIAFLGLCIWSALHYKNYLLGYGPHVAASSHGVWVDKSFNITTIVTGIVFFLTHIALFYFAWKYSGKKGQKSAFMSHDNKLEVLWTALPALVMAGLVFNGLITWNKVMADVSTDDDYLEIGVTGYQFAWALRYPGADGELGEKNFRKITGKNILGQDWEDSKNWDDFIADELVLPVGQKIRARISARDVLHSFFLPHFRVKMDAVPGMPTYFVFTPTTTTEEYRQQLKEYKEYQAPDPNQPEKQLWETFNFELACAELCGKGHFSMRKKVRVVSQEEYDAWIARQKSFYLTSIRHTDEDPYKNDLLPMEIKAQKHEFDEALSQALKETDADKKIVVFKHVNFKTGSAHLTELSRYEIQNLIEALNANPNLSIELRGHTDNVGNPESNMTLSAARANAVWDYLKEHQVDMNRITAIGYGQTMPIGDNSTDEGRQKNRRTEFKILTQ